MFHILSLCVTVFFLRAASNSTSGWRSLRQGFVWSVCFWNTFKVCVCGSSVASTPEVSGRNMYFAFLVSSPATDVVFELASPGHFSRDSCTTQVLAGPGFRFAQVVLSCCEVLPKLLPRQAGSSMSLPLVCLGCVCSACWVTLVMQVWHCVSIKVATVAECSLPSRVCVLFRVISALSGKIFFALDFTDSQCQVHVRSFCKATACDPFGKAVLTMTQTRRRAESLSEE